MFVFPSPISPFPPPPQHFALPSLSIAQNVCQLPSNCMAVLASDEASISVTCVGEDLSVVVSSPTCPAPFDPQHFTFPSFINAHVVCAPITTSTAVFASDDPSISDTCTGVDRAVVVPSPTSPFEFLPQHLIAPLSNSAHPPLTPTAICVAVVMPVTCVGAG